MEFTVYCYLSVNVSPLVRHKVITLSSFKYTKLRQIILSRWLGQFITTHECNKYGKRSLKPDVATDLTKTIFIMFNLRFFIVLMNYTHHVQVPATNAIDELYFILNFLSNLQMF